MLDEALSRGWEDLVGRWGGPMSFRFLMQPAVAMLFAIRAGVRDARKHAPPLLWAALSNPGSRRERWQQIWADVGTVFVVALILDSIYQIVVHSGIFTLELLITAAALALLPYIIARSLVTLVANRVIFGKPAVRPSAGDKEKEN